MLKVAASPALKKYLQCQIDADTQALAKLAKKIAPTLATQLAALKEAEKTLLKQDSERKDKETVGRQKAAARIAERRLSSRKQGVN